MDFTEPPTMPDTSEDYQKLLLYSDYIMLYHSWMFNISNTHLQSASICWSCYYYYWKRLEKTKWNENTVRLSYPWPAEQTLSHSVSFSDWLTAFRAWISLLSQVRGGGSLLFEVDLIGIIAMVLFIFVINKKQATENPVICGGERRVRKAKAGAREQDGFKEINLGLLNLCLSLYERIT